jgi:hypothetical protein
MAYRCLLQCAVKYDIVGDGMATELFTINEDTGSISVKSALTDDIGLDYKVSLK